MAALPLLAHLEALPGPAWVQQHCMAPWLHPDVYVAPEPWRVVMERGAARVAGPTVSSTSPHLGTARCGHVPVSGHAGQPAACYDGVQGTSAAALTVQVHGLCVDTAAPQTCHAGDPTEALQQGLNMWDHEGMLLAFASASTQLVAYCDQSGTLRLIPRPHAFLFQMSTLRWPTGVRSLVVRAAFGKGLPLSIPSTLRSLRVLTLLMAPSTAGSAAAAAGARAPQHGTVAAGAGAEARAGGRVAVGIGTDQRRRPASPQRPAASEQLQALQGLPSLQVLELLDPQQVGRMPVDVCTLRSSCMQASRVCLIRKLPSSLSTSQSPVYVIPTSAAALHPFPLPLNLQALGWACGSVQAALCQLSQLTRLRLQLADFRELAWGEQQAQAATLAANAAAIPSAGALAEVQGCEDRGRGASGQQHQPHQHPNHVPRSSSGDGVPQGYEALREAPLLLCGSQSDLARSAPSQASAGSNQADGQPPQGLPSLAHLELVNGWPGAFKVTGLALPNQLTHLTLEGFSILSMGPAGGHGAHRSTSHEVFGAHGGLHSRQGQAGKQTGMAGRQQQEEQGQEQEQEEEEEILQAYLGLVDEDPEEAEAWDQAVFALLKQQQEEQEQTGGPHAELLARLLQLRQKAQQQQKSGPGASPDEGGAGSRARAHLPALRSLCLSRVTLKAHVPSVLHFPGLTSLVAHDVAVARRRKQDNFHR